MNKHALYLALLAASAVSANTDVAERPPVQGEDTPAADRITVSATRGVRTVSEVTSSVDVFSAEEIDRELVRDIEDLVRYTPGVDVGAHAGRFGLTGFTIRGISGNRVLMELDGVRVPDSFSIGNFSNAGRNLVDLDQIKAVEIVRGSASSLYGSSALGGVVSFFSKDPEDYLNGEAFHGRVKLGYSAVDASRLGNLTLAGGGETWSWLLGLSGSEGHESVNQGHISSADNTRTTPNPQDSAGRSLLVKTVYAPSADTKIRLTLEQGEDETDTEGYWYRTTANGVRTTDLDGHDTQEHERIQLDIELDQPRSWMQAALLQVYVQDSATTQQTLEQQTVLASGSQRERGREFHLQQDVQGIEGTFAHGFDAAGRHLVTWGFEWLETHNDEIRNGYQLNHTTGVRSPVVGPDTFPVRDYPVTEQQERALYVQDEWEIGPVTLVPALRYDRYQLDSQPDAIFSADNPGVIPTNYTLDHTSPKLGLLYEVGSAGALHAQYAEGFRAPPVNDVNVGFTNLMFGYTALPNPELKAETSASVELGWRYDGDGLYIDLTVFDNDYADFINSFTVVSAPPQTPLVVFQSQNIDRVNIHGVELKAELDLQALLDRSGLRVRFAAAHAEGENELTGAELDTVAPDRGVLGLRWQDREDRFGAELVARWAAKAEAVASTNFVAPSYTAFDLLAEVRFGAQVTLQAAVFNLSNEFYYDWQSVRGQRASSTTVERYSAPGRNAAVNLIVSF